MKRVLLATALTALTAFPAMAETIVITPTPRKPSDPQVVYLDAAIILGMEVFVRDYCSKVRGIEPDRAAIRAFNDRIGQPIDNDSWFRSQEPDWQRYVGLSCPRFLWTPYCSEKLEDRQHGR